jgi:predicted hydrocarbon binding protein
MIDRKEFMKTCAATFCTAGMACAAHAVQLNASTQPAGVCEPDQLNTAKGKLETGQLRFAKFVECMEKRFDESERKQLFNGFGHQCARTYRASLLDRYKGDIRGFLDEGLRNWMAEAHYDEDAGTIRIVDKSPTCTCPLVKEGTTPASFCDCTLGWQEEAYATILGRPVRAELEESLLRGDKRCVFRINVI